MLTLYVQLLQMHKMVLHWPYQLKTITTTNTAGEHYNLLLKERNDSIRRSLRQYFKRGDTTILQGCATTLIQESAATLLQENTTTLLRESAAPKTNDAAGESRVLGRYMGKNDCLFLHRRANKPRKECKKTSTQ